MTSPVEKNPKNPLAKEENQNKDPKQSNEDTENALEEQIKKLKARSQKLKESLAAENLP